MELLYIWVKEYKNIKNQGFNFSPKYRFDYDKEKYELTYEKRKTIDNFFGTGISNVTAIVGENGAGKTTLLEILSQIPSPLRTTPHISGEKLFFSNASYIIIFSENDQILIETNIELITQLDYISLDKNNSMQLKIIYHSYIYTRQGVTVESNTNNIKDISTENLTNSLTLTRKDNAIKINVNDIIKQVDFLINNQKENYIPENILKLPKYLMLSVNISRMIFLIRIDDTDKNELLAKIKTIAGTENKLFQAYVLKRLHKNIKSLKAKDYKDKKQKILPYIEEIMEDIKKNNGSLSDFLSWTKEQNNNNKNYGCDSNMMCSNTSRIG